MAEKKIVTNKAVKKSVPSTRPIRPIRPKSPIRPTVLTAPLYDIAGKEVGTVNLPAALFNIPLSEILLAQYVRVYLANQRQGTASTKTRSQIVGSTRKIYKQKGTGRARHGARKAPIFVGGGVAFGPHPQDHSLSFSKKQRTKALFMSLSAQLKNNNIAVIQDLAAATGKTKQMNTLFSTMNVKNNILFIYSKDVANAALGSTNLPKVTVKDASVLNAYDVMKAQKVVFAKESLDQFLEVKQKQHEN